MKEEDHHEGLYNNQKNHAAGSEEINVRRRKDYFTGHTDAGRIPKATGQGSKSHAGR